MATCRGQVRAIATTAANAERREAALARLEEAEAELIALEDAAQRALAVA